VRPVRSGITNAATQRNKNTEKNNAANENDAGKFHPVGVLIPDLAPELLVLALAIAALAGFVKGAIGFAMPMILFSGLGSFLPAEVTVAALILPTVVTNVMQAFRNGLGHAWASFRRFWRFNLIVFVTILCAAQLVTVFPQAVLFGMLGVMISAFAILQLAGWRPRLAAAGHRGVETLVALIAGFFGGLTGIWGPPTVLYLTALEVPKAESVRVQGVMYLAGSILLLGAHLQSGVLNAATLPISALLVAPALVAQWLGMKLHDRMDQDRFRQATLAVLVIAGLNLVRRAALV
jgi:uncharacterized membrane protein YfcA